MLGAAIFTLKYTKSVADFLAANRCAGRYMLSVASGIAMLGAIAFVGIWQMYYEAGFTAIWWGMPLCFVYLLMTASGYIIYRYRETRAMTLAQFFEIRYGRKFRVFAGTLAFISGMLNFGIFPAVGAKFFMYFCGLPVTIYILGYGLSTFVCVMGVLVFTSLCFTWMGGQIALIITDFFQGMFTNIVFILIIIFCITIVDWQDMVHSLSKAPEGMSMVHPMHTTHLKNFNVWYFLIGLFGTVYAYMSFQGSQGYQCSAKSPHEAKMASILANWRAVAMTLLLLMVPIVSYTIMHNPQYKSIAAGVTSILSSMGNKQDQSQMTVPLVLTAILPIGLRGALCAAILAAFITTHDTFMHSWGSIFIQDIVGPLRKKTIEAKKHLLWLRLSVLGVAIYIFIFSLFFRQTQAILMFWAITGSIFLAGSGSALIGGLYWKKGTTAGAFGAMIVGSSLSVIGFSLDKLWPGWYGVDFPVNGQYVFGIAIASSITTYVVLSLIQNRTFDIPRMLHRTKDIDDDKKTDQEVTPNLDSKKTIMNRLGFSKEFTRFDKAILWSVIFWSTGWFIVFIIGTTCSLLYDVPDSYWFRYWLFYIWISLIVAVVVTIWFIIGGLINLKDMIRRLSTIDRNDKDDGVVIDHHNRDEDT